MSVVVLWASPDKNGITATAKNNLIKGIQAGGEKSLEVHLNEKRIMSCLACGKGGLGKCLSEGKCIIDDSLQEIYEEMQKADALALVTPVYWHNMSENFKALLDRIRRLETNHNHFLQGKRAIIVACAGGYGVGTVECLARIEETLSHMEISVCDRIPIERFNQDYMIPAIYEAGKNFAEKYKTFRFDQFDFWK